MVLQKAGEYIEMIKNLGNKTSTIVFQMNKNLKNILILMSNLQSTFPFLLTAVLTDYMQLCQITIQNSDWFLGDTVIKAGLLGICKILKTFPYYTSPETFQQTVLISKQKTGVEAQNLCHQQFAQFFTEKVIEGFFNTFVLKILPTSRDRIITEEAVENLVETGNLSFLNYSSQYLNLFLDVDTYLDETLKEIDNTLFNICLATVEGFLNRFPAFCMKLIHTLAAKALECKIHVSRLFF